MTLETSKNVTTKATVDCRCYRYQRVRCHIQPDLPKTIKSFCGAPWSHFAVKKRHTLAWPGWGHLIVITLWIFDIFGINPLFSSSFTTQQAADTNTEHVHLCFLVFPLIKLTLVWCFKTQQRAWCTQLAMSALPDSLINISLFTCSPFIRIPKVLCFKSYLRFADLHWLSLMRQPECHVSSKTAIYKLWFPSSDYMK